MYAFRSTLLQITTLYYCSAVRYSISVGSLRLNESPQGESRRFCSFVKLTSTNTTVELFEDFKLFSLF